MSRSGFNLRASLAHFVFDLLLCSHVQPFLLIAELPRRRSPRLFRRASLRTFASLRARSRSLPSLLSMAFRSRLPPIDELFLWWPIISRLRSLLVPCRRRRLSLPSSLRVTALNRHHQHPGALGTPTILAAARSYRSASMDLLRRKRMKHLLPQISDKDIAADLLPAQDSITSRRPHDAKFAHTYIVLVIGSLY